MVVLKKKQTTTTKNPNTSLDWFCSREKFGGELLFSPSFYYNLYYVIISDLEMSWQEGVSL